MKSLLLICASLLSVACSFQSLSYGQSKNSKKAVPPASRVSLPTPVVFATKKDGLPKTLNLRGEITQVSFAGASCGDIFWSGTAKIRLLQKIDGYSHQDVFLVIPCFLDPNNERKYLNKVVQFEVSKLYPEYKHYSKTNPCSYSVIINTIDSHGISFYCSLMGQQDILKNIERNSAVGP